MSRLSRVAIVIVSAWVLLLALPLDMSGQGRSVRRHPPHPQPAVALRGHVFVGGYFYDPVFGPYPWWPRAAYPYWYYPVYDNRAFLRIQVKPDEDDRAAVYADGFYAGIVDEYDGVFQSLPLPPGGHSITLYLEGYRTVRHNIYLSPGSTFTLRETLQKLPPGVRSEPPEVVPPVPPPPEGSGRLPATPPKVAGAGVPAPGRAASLGTIDLFVQPTDADVTIDGRRWLTNEDGHYVVQVPIGKHRVEISKPGYRPVRTEIEVRSEEMTPINVTLTATTT
jgi:hypothetical protein